MTKERGRLRRITEQQTVAMLATYVFLLLLLWFLAATIPFDSYPSDEYMIVSAVAIAGLGTLVAVLAGRFGTPSVISALSISMGLTLGSVLYVAPQAIPCHTNLSWSGFPLPWMIRDNPYQPPIRWALLAKSSPLFVPCQIMLNPANYYPVVVLYFALDILFYLIPSILLLEAIRTTRYRRAESLAQAPTSNS